MKTQIELALLIVLAAGFVSVQAEDNPSQAAARAALIKKLNVLDAPLTPPPPAQNSSAAVASPGKPENQPEQPVVLKPETPPTVPLTTNMTAAPAPEKPGVVTSPAPPRWDVAAAGSQTNMVVAPAAEAPAAGVRAAVVQPVPAPGNPQPPAASSLPARPAHETSAAVAPAASVRMVAAPPQELQPLTAPPKPKPAALIVGAKTTNPPKNGAATHDLVTTTGAIYKNAAVEKVEADGVIVSYSPAGGGLAIAKIYFDDLPAVVRQQYERKKPVVVSEKPAAPAVAAEPQPD
jgi:hypothetical protein